MPRNQAPIVIVSFPKVYVILESLHGGFLHQIKQALAASNINIF